MALIEEFETQGVWLFKYRSNLPIIILILAFGLNVYTELHPEAYPFKTNEYAHYYQFLCLFVCFIGLFIRIYTVGHTPQNTSGRNTETQVADTLNTTGIYSLVRHPLYLGNFFMWLGAAMLTAHGWFVLVFCLYYWVYYERIMFAEEQFLRRKFGEVYTNWAANVPAFMPKFGGFVPPNISFSIKKVLKKEKNGLAAIFAIFLIFDISGQWVKNKNNYNYFLIFGCAATGILYLVLKYLKKYTNTLNEEGR